MSLDRLGRWREIGKTEFDNHSVPASIAFWQLHAYDSESRATILESVRRWNLKTTRLPLRASVTA